MWLYLWIHAPGKLSNQFFNRGYFCDIGGMDAEPAFWGPTESSIYGFLVFVALFALGTILGIIGLVIVPREESTRRYKIISRVGFYSHFIPVIFIAALVTLYIG